MIKMYAVFCRETLCKFEQNEGKLAAQAGHAYLHAWWDAEKRSQYDFPDIYSDVIYDYKYNDDARKIALVTNTVDDLRRLYEMYKPICGVTLVEDCGYTIFTEPTITAVGIGPIRDEDKCAWLRNMELLRHEL